MACETSERTLEERTESSNRVPKTWRVGPEEREAREEPTEVTEVTEGVCESA